MRKCENAQIFGKSQQIFCEKPKTKFGQFPIHKYFHAKCQIFIIDNSKLPFLHFGG